MHSHRSAKRGHESSDARASNGMTSLCSKASEQPIDVTHKISEARDIVHIETLTINMIHGGNLFLFLYRVFRQRKIGKIARF